MECPYNILVSNFILFTKLTIVYLIFTEIYF